MPCFQPGEGTSRGLLRDSELSCRPSFQALVSAAAAPHQHQPRQCAESRGDQRENNQLDTNMAFAAARILKDKQQKEQQQENKRVIHITHPWTALCVLHTRLSCHIWSSYYVTVYCLIIMLSWHHVILVSWSPLGNLGMPGRPWQP